MWITKTQYFNVEGYDALASPGVHIAHVGRACDNFLRAKLLHLRALGINLAELLGNKI